MCDCTTHKVPDGCRLNALQLVQYEPSFQRAALLVAGILMSERSPVDSDTTQCHVAPRADGVSRFASATSRVYAVLRLARQRLQASTMSYGQLCQEFKLNKPSEPAENVN